MQQGGARDIMVIVVGNGLGDLTLNPERGVFISHNANTLGEGMREKCFHLMVRLRTIQHLYIWKYFFISFCCFCFIEFLVASSDKFSRNFSKKLWVNSLCCSDIVVWDFEMQTYYNIHFWTNTLGKSMNPLIPI